MFHSCWEMFQTGNQPVDIVIGSRIDLVYYGGRVTEKVRQQLCRLEAEYDNCQRCGLWESRTQIVFGKGSEAATVLLLAERPGRQDDLTGHPFSGPSGDLLDRILAAPRVDIPPSAVYITNMVLCRARQDRSPRVSEIRACNDRLQREIALVNPALIVAMGRLPMQYYLGIKGKMERQRGWRQTLVRGRRVPVFLTFNPASALYGQAWEIKRKKRMMYEDWKQIGAKYRELKTGEGGSGIEASRWTMRDDIES